MKYKKQNKEITNKKISSLVKKIQTIKNKHQKILIKKHIKYTKNIKKITLVNKFKKLKKFKLKTKKALNDNNSKIISNVKYKVQKKQNVRSRINKRIRKKNLQKIIKWRFKKFFYLNLPNTTYNASYKKKNKAKSKAKIIRNAFKIPRFYFGPIKKITYSKLYKNVILRLKKRTLKVKKNNSHCY